MTSLCITALWCGDEPHGSGEGRTVLTVPLSSLLPRLPVGRMGTADIKRGAPIARLAEGKLELSDLQVSRNHCEIELSGENGRLLQGVSDLSTNGTTVDGRRIRRGGKTSVPSRSLATIRVGLVELSLKMVRETSCSTDGNGADGGCVHLESACLDSDRGSTESMVDAIQASSTTDDVDDMDDFEIPARRQIAENLDKGTSIQSTRTRKEPIQCPLCMADITRLSQRKRELHVDQCLGGEFAASRAVTASPFTANTTSAVSNARPSRRRRKRRAVEIIGREEAEELALATAISQSEWGTSDPSSALRAAIFNPQQQKGVGNQIKQRIEAIDAQVAALNRERVSLCEYLDKVRAFEASKSTLETEEMDPTRVTDALFDVCNNHQDFGLEALRGAAAVQQRSSGASSAYFRHSALSQRSRDVPLWSVAKHGIDDENSGVAESSRYRSAALDWCDRGDLRKTNRQAPDHDSPPDRRKKRAPLAKGDANERSSDNRDVCEHLAMSRSVSHTENSTGGSHAIVDLSCPETLSKIGSTCAASKTPCDDSVASDDSDASLLSALATDGEKEGGGKQAALARFIRDEPDIFLRTSKFEVIDLDDVHRRLRRAGHKVSIKELSSFLDERSVMWRRAASG